MLLHDWRFLLLTWRYLSLSRTFASGTTILVVSAANPLVKRGIEMAGTALVTGASSGIGEKTAKGLLAAGYIVYAGARRVDAMRSLEAAGARVLSLDVTDDASMTAAVDAILRETGRIDVLVNNAGYGTFGALEDVPLDEGRRQFEVNRADHQRLVG